MKWLLMVCLLVVTTACSSPTTPTPPVNMVVRGKGCQIERQRFAYPHAILLQNVPERIQPFEGMRIIWGWDLQELFTDSTHSREIIDGASTPVVTLTCITDNIGTMSNFYILVNQGELPVGTHERNFHIVTNNLLVLTNHYFQPALRRRDSLAALMYVDSIRMGTVK